MDLRCDHLGAREVVFISFGSIYLLSIRQISELRRAGNRDKSLGIVLTLETLKTIGERLSFARNIAKIENLVKIQPKSGSDLDLRCGHLGARVGFPHRSAHFFCSPFAKSQNYGGQVIETSL